jgi:hypothetical protein
MGSLLLDCSVSSSAACPAGSSAATDAKNEQPQGKPCGIDKIFCCLIGVTYSALPKYADYSQCQDTIEFSSKSSLFTAAASRRVLNRIGFA